MAYLGRDEIIMKGFTMISRVSKSLLTVMVVLFFGGQVLAGLATDPGAYVDSVKTWSGSVTFSDTLGQGLSGEIEYAVFAPGGFTYSGYTPTPGEFVYAYQITSTGTAPISMLSVTMLDSNEANNISTFVIDGLGISPDSLDFAGAIPNLGSAQWNWNVNGIATGEGSVGLVYSSINAPMDLFGTVQDTGAQAMVDLPAPSDVIPEPASMLLVGIGSLMMIVRRK